MPTRDRQGLEDARRPQTLLEAIVKVLEGEGEHLPEKDQGKPDVTRDPNPFG
jgi:hypothetical protein